MRSSASLTLAFALAALFAFTMRPPAATAQSITQFGIPADDNFRTEDSADGPFKSSANHRSAARQTADALLQNVRNGGILGYGISFGSHRDEGSTSHVLDNGNVQINDPSLDNIQAFTSLGTRPFEFSTQSETSVARDGRNVVVGYNSSAGGVVQFFPGFGLFYTQLLFTAYSVSHDGGQTWKSDFAPPVPGSAFTFGDPAMAVDRKGNFYYASLGADPAGNTTININESTDHGDTFGPATIVATDNGGDKEWLAIGPDPVNRKRDNIYVTWTSFQNDGSSQLWFASSIDGGATWSSRAIFVPVADAINSADLSFTNPVVDKRNGRLYVPFLHFSNIDADNVRVLVSDDAGATFHFLAFNVSGAPDPYAYPNVTPGDLVDCGQDNGGLRNVLHQGTDDGGGRFGLARYEHATRLVTQPAAAVVGGHLWIALQTSTSPFFGDPNAGSQITLLYSPNGGRNWAPPRVIAPSTSADPQHVHPAISLTNDGDDRSAYVGYYVQGANTRLRTDIAKLHLDDDGLKIQASSLSNTDFDLTPDNIAHPIAGNPFFTTNYDRAVVACYNIGEYMSVTAGNGGPIAAWGDNRNSWTGPADSAAPGTHPQPDVFVGGPGHGD